MTAAADLTYLPWVGPAAGTDAPCVVADRRDVALDARLQHVHQLRIPAEFADARDEQIAHVPHDLRQTGIQALRHEHELPTRQVGRLSGIRLGCSSA